MSRRDVRLRAIRAEIHKCRDELVFLGCEDQNLKHWRDDALRRIIAQFELMAPQITNSPLGPFVDGVTPLLQQLMNASFDTVKTVTTFLDQAYSFITPLLDKLAHAISNVAFSDKIKEIETNIVRATKVHPTNADQYLQSILHMIGAHLILIYYEFMNESWLRPVAMSIPTISGILHDV
jgi:hypothetical protein